MRKELPEIICKIPKYMADTSLICCLNSTTKSTCVFHYKKSRLKLCTLISEISMVSFNIFRRESKNGIVPTERLVHTLCKHESKFDFKIWVLQEWIAKAEHIATCANDSLASTFNLHSCGVWTSLITTTVPGATKFGDWNEVICLTSPLPGLTSTGTGLSMSWQRLNTTT